MAEHDPIDFGDLAAALLQRADTLVPQWLPDGKHRGAEYVCGGLGGGAGESFSVNLTTGRWAEFAGDDRGGDLISLYAAIEGLNNGQAARRLMRDLGWEKSGPSSAPVRSRSRAPDGDERPEPPADAGQGELEGGVQTPAKRRSVWSPVVPVPAVAPAPDFKHWHYSAIERSWEYRLGDALYGYVVRFKTSDGGKEILPHTWCVDEGDSRGLMRWHWKQWNEPRPLYVPATILASDPRLVPVVLVEGEKCAMAGHQLLGHEFDFVSWPGGSNAWAKADWSWLKGRVVYLWPDCDAKRARLSKAEREAGVDPATKPLQPEAVQPGMRAMVSIGSVLAADQACTVLMCPMPKPGDVSDGWDVADAIESGWGPEEVRAFVRGAHAFVPPDDTARAKAGSTQPSAGAIDDVSHAWRSFLLKSVQGAVKSVRENVVYALDGVPERQTPGIAEAAGVIAFNDFTNDVIKLKDTPWGTPAGVWDEVDELEMGSWLTREHWLPSMPRTTLEESVAMVAKRHRYHPAVAELAAFRGKWDGVRRTHSWLRRCCLAEDDEADHGSPLHRYLERVGTWLLMAMCARVLTPGCKFDYMVIFEGAQGVGKSTLARLLGGDHFADTGLVLGDKDSYQNLQGVWVYEWGELDSLNRSEVTKVKQFISSMKDRFRASFDRRAKDYPRQVVFIGTTNEDHYLVDPTGNRRMWPVRVTRQVDIQWFRENRAQLFAEALHRLEEEGQRFHPTPKEQRDLFEPQQQQRQIENAIQAEVMRYLYDEDQRVGMTGENGSLVQEITVQELLHRMGISVDKRTHVVLRQATAAMRQAGWVRFKSSRGDRPWMFKRPGADGAHDAPGGSGSKAAGSGHATTGAGDDCPF